MTEKRTSQQSARRALRVLKALRGHTHTGLANVELAQALDESAVNICRALEALEAEGLATKLANGRWAHSVALLQIAQAHAEHTARLTARISETNARIAAGAY